MKRTYMKLRNKMIQIGVLNSISVIFICMGIIGAFMLGKLSMIFSISIIFGFVLMFVSAMVSISTMYYIAEEDEELEEEQEG